MEYENTSAFFQNAAKKSVREVLSKKGNTDRILRTNRGCKKKDKTVVRGAAINLPESMA